MAAPQPVGVPGKFAAGIRKLCRDAIGKAFKAAGSKMKLAGCIFAVLVGIVGVLRLLRGPASQRSSSRRRGGVASATSAFWTPDSRECR